MVHCITSSAVNGFTVYIPTTNLSLAVYPVSSSHCMDPAEDWDPRRGQAGGVYVSSAPDG